MANRVNTRSPRPGVGWSFQVTVSYEKLARVMARLKGREIERILREHLQETMDAVLEYVPVDTGALHDSVRIETKEVRSNYAKVVVTAGGAPLVADYRNKKAVNYAPWVEFGTPRRPATPYLQPAWDDTKENVLHNLREAFNAYITKGKKK